MFLSRLKDSQHALQIFRDFNFLGEDKLIFTMDITSGVESIVKNAYLASVVEEIQY